MMNKIISVLAISTVLWLCGCATTGYQRASQTRSAMDEVQAVTGNIQHDLDAAVRALQTLTSQEATNLQPSYLAFTSAVTGLGDQVARFTHRSQAFRKRADAYAAAWQEDLKAYRSADLRTLSAERRAEVVESFRKLNSELQAAEASLRALLVSLNDMRRYLGTDLTAAGVTAGQEQAANISTQAGEVQEHLQLLSADLSRVATGLSPLRPAKEEPAQTSPSQ